MLDQDFEALALVIVLSEAVREQRKRKAMLPYVMRRQEYGVFHSLVQELAEQVSRCYSVHTVHVITVTCICASLSE